VLDDIDTGSKAALRPIPEKFMNAIANVGPLEIPPKLIGWVRRAYDTGQSYCAAATVPVLAPLK
jgi:hypothetical protein